MSISGTPISDTAHMQKQLKSRRTHIDYFDPGCLKLGAMVNNI